MENSLTMKLLRFALALLSLAALLPLSPTTQAEEKKTEPLVVVVMDPLAAPLSCPCVKGYAQRDYEKLGKFLEKELGRPVKVHFGETLTNTLQKKSGGKADIIIGKCSVVQHEAKANNLRVAPLAALTGKDGKTTQTGMIVVAAKDPAIAIADLKGYRIYFGPEDCEEKYDAAMALLKANEVTVKDKPDTCAACTEGATMVIRLHQKGEKVATVISSYAQPLLEGCGTIQKGDLRVVGETDPVPFIRAFANERLSATDRTAVQNALLKVAQDKDLCKVMETKLGFVPTETVKKN
jgi:ABC-type phosphate/phosphonate transport system substrate-binding protein